MRHRIYGNEKEHIRMAERADGKNFIHLLKRMLVLDQEHRITPHEALNHNFVTLNHLADYAHCSIVKASDQMMKVCRGFHSVQSSHIVHSPLNQTNLAMHHIEQVHNQQLNAHNSTQIYLLPTCWEILFSNLSEYISW